MSTVKPTASTGKSKGYTVETSRTDAEHWNLDEKTYRKFQTIMKNKLGPQWRYHTAINEVAREWLYENFMQPNKEFCGEGQGFSISKD